MAYRNPDTDVSPDLALSRNYLLRAMDKADIERLRPHLTPKTLPRDTILYEPGEAVTQIYFPGSAVMSVITVMNDGRAVESATVGYESVVGLLPSLGSTVSLSRTLVQIGGVAVQAPAARFREAVFSSANLRDLVIRHALANVAQAQQSVACNALHGLIGRLSRWLLLSQDRTESRFVPLTQEYLGIMLGVQRTTVSAAAQVLQQAGLIRYVRGSIEIVDRSSLELKACECYRTIRHNTDELLTT